MEVARLCTGRLLDGHAAVPFKLQMAAISSQRQLLFVALRGYVLVFDIDHCTRMPTLRSRLQHPELTELNDEINAITLGELHGVETVVAVCDSGRVVAWGVHDGFPVLWDRPGTASTWGCAISRASGAVATSANSHQVQIDEGLSVATTDSNASIDRTTRIWSLAGGQCVFAFEYHQWCWSVLFVDPFYFFPARWPPGKPSPHSEAAATATGSQSSAEGSGQDDVQREHTRDAAFAAVGVHSLENAIDHTADMQNGYSGERDGQATDTTDSRTSAVEIQGLADGAIEPDSGVPAAASSALLLCSTATDLLLLDPIGQASPVVDRIERVVARAARPTLTEMWAFDRVTFLEWIPELGVAIAGSLSGTAAIVRVSAAISDGGAGRPWMQVLARIPEHAPTSQLYGTALYRHPEDTANSSAAVVYLLFLDGTLSVYELRLLRAPDAGQSGPCSMADFASMP
ncbi:hypothetical protein LPJ61_003017 [Coemansia biformis]|uniref:WD40 repeat-like protein n=1 Tax=Coemansia biformis TaxID=1286918 RepID=A0A9W7YC67_9FUNG|nr:hypothetical protein LPJ61_003017 [Coemansia biformis]